MPDRRNDSAAAVLEVERRWVQAHRELDVDTIGRIMADDYRQVRPDGSVIGKAQAMRSYRSGKRSWEHAASDEHQLTVHGDVAILIGRWKARGTNDGTPFDYAARFLAVYVRRAGAWQLAAEQATKIEV